MFDPSKDYTFFKYPVYYQQQNGYLVFHCPDLHLMVTTDLPIKRMFNSEYAHKLAKTMLEMESKVRDRVKSMKSSRIKVPQPSRVKNIIDTSKIKRLTAPQVAKLIGKSADTVRRMADRGSLPCHKSKAGTRYFLEKDIVEYII